MIPRTWALRAVLFFSVAACVFPPVARADEPSLYEIGTAARQRGDHKAAKVAFAKMLAKDPNSKGALEGIALACLALDQPDEALKHLERWNRLSPGSDYIHGLLERARRESEAAKAPKPVAAPKPPEPPKPVEPPKPAEAPAPAPPSHYALGWAARDKGDYRGSKEEFAKLLAEDPKSKGAFEGLSLDCLSLGEYQEAAGYLEKWKEVSPGSPYVLGLLARAQRGAGDDDGALKTTIELVDADPKNYAARKKIDGIMYDEKPGLFGYGRLRKSLSSEGIGTAAPQRVVYEGRSGGLRARVRATKTLSLLAGAELVEDAQSNDTRGFIYYDVLEHIYTFGAEYRPRKDLFFSGEYGQEVINNVKGNGLAGETLFSRVKLASRVRWRETDFSLDLARTPYFDRGAGGNNFFALLRDDSARLQAERDALGVTWRARAGIDDISEGTTLKSFSFQGTKEFGNNLIVPSYSHSWQDFYGAAPDGRVQYVLTDRWGARARRLVDEKYQIGGSAGYTTYADGNHLTDSSLDLTGWLPWWKELSGTYRFDSFVYKYNNNATGYNSLTEFYQWLGAAWRRDWGRGFITRVAYEHGFLWDVVRTHYDGSAWTGELEWYRRERLSLKAQGRYGVDTVRDQSWSAGLQARFSF